jgi:MFS family permease
VILVSVCFNYFLENLLRSAPSALSPVIIDELGLTHSMAGLLISSYSLLYAVMQIPGGIFSDALGPRRTIIGFPLFSVAGGFLFYLGSRVEMLILAQMLIGLGFSVFYINAIKLISNWFPPKMQATAIGVLSAALGMGSFAAYIGFPLSSNLAGGWRTLYLYCCALLMVNLIANFFILRDNPSSKTELKANSIGPALVDVFRDLRLYPLLVGYILAGFGWVFASWIPQFLTDARGFSYIEAGLVSSAGTLAGIPGCILIGAISDRLRRRKLPLVAFSVAYSCLLALFLSFPRRVPLTLFLIVNAACGFTVSLWVLLFSMVPETLPPDKAGIGLGVLNSVGTLGFTLLAPIYGALVDASGGYLPSNAIILIGGVLMTIVFAIFTRETYRGVEET